MKGVAKVMVGVCPGCDTKIRFEEAPQLGQLVVCPECSDTLEVVRRAPLELDWAFEEALDEDEEWDDDWDDDEWEDEDWDEEDDWDEEEWD